MGVEIENMQFSVLDQFSTEIVVMAVWLLALRDQSRAPDAKDRPGTESVPRLWVHMLSKWRHNEH